MRKIAFLGPSYTFSDMCYQWYFKDDYQPIHKKTIEDVFSSLDDFTDILVPIENSTDGFVQKTLDQLIQHDGFIISTMSIPVQFGCIGDPLKAKTLYVQFKSLGQCQHFIVQYPHLDIILTASNQASFDLKKREDEVAIIPLHMIEDIPHISHIEDFQNNQTRFIHISKKQVTSDEYAAMVITPKVDRPGLLYDILGVFKAHHINLIAIMSRPTKTIIGTYHFYIETSLMNSTTKNLHEVITIMSETFDIRFLGTYKKK
ncbi:MAG: prephenate dehydratase [Acholeplasmataceae bacterium]